MKSRCRRGASCSGTARRGRRSICCCSLLLGKARSSVTNPSYVLHTWRTLLDIPMNLSWRAASACVVGIILVPLSTETQQPTPTDRSQRNPRTHRDQRQPHRGRNVGRRLSDAQSRRPCRHVASRSRCRSRRCREGFRGGRRAAPDSGSGHSRARRDDDHRAGAQQPRRRPRATRVLYTARQTGGSRTRSHDQARRTRRSRFSRDSRARITTGARRSPRRRFSTVGRATRSSSARSSSIRVTARARTIACC